ncbi:hypothetical protein HKBW3S03_01387 [Candidatus Hakubella thermalkaliphila]|uniref:FHA domain-containing protein n=1 Tax=Candidatus Hakubella thermalkaliphila TaxID=2754717 RepID=A0A6V8NI56_9ACTN|nr:FHA domain-containing protein [Candidatus Hakubella thermalkaliphila]GFP19883.1 hypothetical protein HKBW3S03_01387 [Candidatus Hakubella thermalkaliphila]GFP23438.1 hypothetical protein HKBW3S09_00905 [Candidatus Hakubella thermalkaliphila]GFP29849.1 hypothetical protein HKBW3S34_00769 [Candidatus Hakubella thermalkaliphila]GFP37372.1 hypothetical protein HKBW3S44_01052 [Candidatus Hakubella thermalkaliphila]GFP40132.1 hypothetical protein HKBW3S47_01830 [Candidatus Hakubella thermalkaliph
MSEGVYGKKCPVCGHINDEIAMVCANNCQVNMLRVTAQYHKVSEQEHLATSLGENKESSIQGSIPKKRQPTVKAIACVARIYPEFNPNLIIEIKDGDTIGREGDIDVSSLPRSEFISRKHATFILEGSSWHIRDNNSMNGTKINFKKLEPHQVVKLNDGDRISLADTTFIFKSS